MSMTLFYRDQAETQQRAADDAALENVRERCQRASNAWSQLAQRSEHGDNRRSAMSIEELVPGVGE